MIKKTTFLKTLLAAAGLCLGAGNVWADVTPFSESYSSSSTTDGWSTSVNGRFDPVILNDDDNYYLSVTQDKRNNNGCVVTGNIISGKAAAGDDFTLTFDMRLSNSNNQTPVELAIKDAANTGVIFSLSATAKNVTTWKVNGQTLQLDLPNSGAGKGVTDITWISYKISRSGSLTYLTVTNKETSDVILARQTIDGASATGGLGNIVFTTRRYNANFAIDNIEVRALQDGDVPVVTPVDYTIKYVDEASNSIADDVVTTSYVGAEVTASAAQMAAIYKDTKKYIYKSGNETITLVANAASNVITLVFREAATYSYTINAVDGSSNILKALASRTAFELDDIQASYPLYLNVNGTLYTKAATDKQYYTTVSLDTDEKVIDYVYSATDIKNVVFLTEGEDITGATIVNTGNAQARSSNAAAGYNTTEGNLTITTLPAGSYSINAVGYFPISGDRTITISDGTNDILTITGASNNWQAGNTTFTLTDAATLYLAPCDANSALDFVYIQQTTASVAIKTTGTTFSSACAIDCANLPSGVKAYKVSTVAGGKATAEEVTEAVAPGTGLIFKATAEKSYDIPVAATGTDISATNLLKAAVTATEVGANEAYGLSDGKFYLLDAGTIPAGKAYLPTSGDTPSPELSIVFGGETTGINEVQGSGLKVNGYYNLNGQRVAQPTKGLYIANGKKFIVK